jgi:hypothetical protein
VGIGDQLIATGIAKGASNRGRKIAFGAGGRLIWDKQSAEIFRGNPNIAHPGEEKFGDVEWVPYYKGRRGYNQDAKDHWVWNMNWRCKPGEMYFTEGELIAGERNKGYIVIEPNVPAWKSSSPNKDWGFQKYQKISNTLRMRGFRVLQFFHPRGGKIIDGAKVVETKSFRDALAILKNSVIYVGPEGGLHHGAAAVGIPAVVLFGGFIPPVVTGYDTHANISHADHFCGSFSPCSHCKEAMAAITVEEVYEAIRGFV